jgi:hypothetical protein
LAIRLVALKVELLVAHLGILMVELMAEWLDHKLVEYSVENSVLYLVELLVAM